jgi:hypothetical protein
MRFLTPDHTPTRNYYRTQNPVPSGECGFESHLRHNKKLLEKRGFLAFKVSFLTHLFPS